MDELTNEREGRRRSQLNYNALERIPIPEGLEERLSAKIDEWEQEERKEKAQRRHLLHSVLRYTAVAASVALVYGVGYHYLRPDEPVNLAEQDTGLSQGNIRIIVMRTKQKLRQQFKKITKTWTN